jgi:lipopolysaccharide/colanic/teichoic acid biosynthesis glycosyltransferase
MNKRFFDLFVSFFALLLLAPFLGLLAAIIGVSSSGGVFYKQIRIGKNGLPFAIFKFRTMFADAEKRGLLTVGDRDPRVTAVGFYLRKYKLDELPQLLNVLLGDMSLVGPRPEVERYTKLYTAEQRKVLAVQPGITDYASIEYANESELLAKATDPEHLYIHTIMPDKLTLNMKYISEIGLITDFKIILKTFLKIISK